MKYFRISFSRSFENDPHIIAKAEALAKPNEARKGNAVARAVVIVLHAPHQVDFGIASKGKAIAIARSCLRAGSRVRFCNVVDLVKRLQTETRNGRQGRLADHLTRVDFIVLDAASSCSTSSAASTSAPIIVTTRLAFGEWPSVSAVPK